MTAQKMKKYIPFAQIAFGLACIVFGLGLLAVHGAAVLVLLGSFAIIIVGLVAALSAYGSLAQRAKEELVMDYTVGVPGSLSSLIIVSGIVLGFLLIGLL